MANVYRIEIREPKVNLVVMIKAGTPEEAREILAMQISAVVLEVQEDPPLPFGISPSDRDFICNTCLKPAIIQGRCHRHMRTKSLT